MSDYFAILASRIAGAPEALRPMLPSRFEPGEASSARTGGREDDSSRMVPTEVERDAPQPVGPLISGVPPQRKEKIAPVATAHHREFPVESPRASSLGERDSHKFPESVESPRASSAAQPDGHKLPESANTAPELPHVPSQLTKPASVQAVTAPVPPPSPSIIAPASPARAEPKPNARRRPVPHPRPSLPDEATPPEKKGGRRDQRTEPAEPQPARASKLTVLPNQSLSRPDRPSGRADHPSLLSAPIAAAPAIQIVIGRIEVQASLPPVATPPQAPKRPAVPLLSLDEYLTRRNGSGT